MEAKQVSLDSQTRSFISRHTTDDVRMLALQAAKYPEINIQAAIIQISGRQAATDKIPSWTVIDELIYPSHLSMEQCSSEATARYKAELVGDGNTFADLTGGFGIDCAFIAQGFRTATYVEQQEELCLIANHNFPLLGKGHICVVNADGGEYLRKMDTVDWIFIDPARRTLEGNKAIAISDCTPNVTALESLFLQKAKHTMIKLSPMLDIAQALHELSSVHQVHVISVGGECKELLLVLNPNHHEGITIHCVNILKNGTRQSFVFNKDEESNAPCTYSSQPGTYLYEPNASILKAGAYRSIAHSFQLFKLHPNSHLYTSNKLIPDFPGRVFRCESSFSLNKKEIRAHLSGLKQANLTVRNFPATVNELRKRLKLSDGGNIYLFATTLADEQKIIIRCSKI
ncbi:MAG: SAM-dependent methyltransferase [Bacteroides sp.]